MYSIYLGVYPRVGNNIGKIDKKPVPSIRVYTSLVYPKMIISIFPIKTYVLCTFYKSNVSLRETRMFCVLNKKRISQRDT